MHDSYYKRKSFIIVMDLLSGGDLARELDRKGSFAEEDAKSITKSVLETLAYLHSTGVAHRDVKLENILLEDRYTTTKVKLIDLGMAKQIENVPDEMNPDKLNHNGHLRRRHSIRGTALFAAPELLTPTLPEPDEIFPEYNKSTYGVKVDIWSMGVVLYMLLGGAPPFPTDGGFELVVASILKGGFDFRDPAWEMVSESAVDLVKQMLTLDPNKRPSAAECLAHTWLKDA
eukprot:scaffold382450_cov39-Prasinocladus_malaysianus.AAC.1